MNNTNASNPGAENKTTSPSSSSSNETLPSSPNNTSTNQLQSSNSTAPLPSSTPTENSTNVNPSANASSSPSLPPSLTSSLSNSKSNATLPSEPSWSNATMTQIPLPTNNSQSTLVAINTVPMLPKYNLTSVINKPIQNSNNNQPGGSNPAVAKPEKESPWPPAPAGCQPNRPTFYGYPDLQICGNGFELITLSAHQLTASSTYSKDTGDKIIQYRHAPYNGLLNNTQNAGAWCAEHQFAVSQDENQYLSIDLGTPNLIGKIATQGMEHWDNWVSTYALKFSVDNINWETYPRTLQGNCDRRSITENILNPPFRARFVSVIPTSWYTSFDPSQHDICMRIGIYRCRDCKLVPVSRCNIEVPVNKTEGSVLKQVTKKAQN